MIEELRMAELLCTRLCHDLAGPIGAVNNGAEFLSEEGFHLQNQAVELIVSSAYSAVTRLQFYRFAYGKVKEQGEASLADKQKLVTEYFTGSKIALDWPDTHTDAAGISISIKMSRMIFNLIILAASALIRGGTIAVRLNQTPAGDKEIVVSASGTGVKWEKDATIMLTEGMSPEQLTPKNVQLYLTRKLAEELSSTIRIAAEAETLSFTVHQPANVKIVEEAPDEE